MKKEEEYNNKIYTYIRDTIGNLHLISQLYDEYQVIGIYGNSDDCKLYLDIIRKTLGDFKCKFIYIQTRTNELEKNNNIYNIKELNNIYMDAIIIGSDLESKLSDPQTSLMILCNPQNPSGKIWDRETLKRIGELCKKYYVTVVSDEIHCDITDPDKEYIPFASVSDICRDISITCIAPTKTFNMAGIQTAAVVVPQKNLRHKVWRALNTDEVAEPNTFAISAAIAAYKNGAEWLDELRQYISNNKQIVYDYVKANIPDINVVKSDATYLLWIDCSKLTKDSRRLAADIRKKTGLYLSAGSVYGKGGERFLRLNIACPESVLKDGLERLKNGLMEINEGSRLRYEMFEYMLEE